MYLSTVAAGRGRKDSMIPWSSVGSRRRRQFALVARSCLRDRRFISIPTGCFMDGGGPVGVIYVATGWSMASILNKKASERVTRLKTCLSLR